jgi:hypothetical protein
MKKCIVTVATRRLVNNICSSWFSPRFPQRDETNHENGIERECNRSMDEMDEMVHTNSTQYAICHWIFLAPFLAKLVQKVVVKAFLLTAL